MTSSGFDNGTVFFPNGIDPRGVSPVVNQMSDGKILIGSNVAPYVICNTLTAPLAGISITGGPGSITFDLANDLAAIEALNNVGVASRSGVDTWTTSAIVDKAVITGFTNGGVGNVGPLTNGQLVIGRTGDYPTVGSLTAGTGVNIVNASGSITVNAAGGGLSWPAVPDYPMRMNNGYFVGSTYFALMPSELGSEPRGSTVVVYNEDGTVITIVPSGATQQIQVGSAISTANTGRVISNTIGDSITLVKRSASFWHATSIVGNWTVT